MPHLLVAVIVGLLTSQLALLLTTLYLHRAVAHRAVTMKAGLAFACRALVWLSTGIKPREWAAVHRRHHAYTDVLGDPHSPVLEGYWKVQLWNIGLYRKAAHDPETLRKYSKDIKVDAWDKRVFDRGLIGLMIGLGILVGALGWRAGLVAAGVHVASYLLVNAAINAIGHRWGKRPFPGIATNNQWLALLAWGEGLHSNHHAAPTSAKFAFEPHQLDHGWWVVCALRKLGWLQVRHDELHFTALAQQAFAKAPPPAREPELV
ncbi:MAG: fatty acid desaturase [Actinomycetota bacterium]|jgi:stearoyl-CoA desaturase (delta-9 desaturase)|nr:fatty acid desaturase [Actinomycetota bacterium]